MSKAIIDEILKVTPSEGFNVVALDRHAEPGARLTLIDHLPTRDAAERCIALLRASAPTGDFEVYAPMNPESR
jgi:hypothetical protein